MQRPPIFGTLKMVSVAVMLLILIAIGYASYISIKYWAGIGV